MKEIFTPVNVGNRPHRDNGEGEAGIPPLPYPLRHVGCDHAMLQAAAVAPEGSRAPDVSPLQGS